MHVRYRAVNPTLAVLSAVFLFSAICLILVADTTISDMRQLRSEQRRMAAACREAIDIVPKRPDIIQELPMMSLWYAEACAR